MCLGFPFTHELFYCFYNCWWYFSQFKTFNYPGVRHAVKNFLVIKLYRQETSSVSCYFFINHFVYQKLVSATAAASFSCCLLFSYDIILSQWSNMNSATNGPIQLCVHFVHRILQCYRSVILWFFSAFIFGK